MNEITVLPILGSLRRGSYNRMALHAARELAPEGVTLLAEPSLREIPPLDTDAIEESGFPPAVTRLAEAVRAADAVLFVSPEYNYSVPGVLKNAIDWVSRTPQQPFKGKPVGLMGASPGPVGTARMQYHLRQVFVFLEAHPVTRPEVMIGLAPSRFDEAGALTDETTAGFIRDYLELLRGWTLRLKAGAP
jgi:chromate reductase